MTFQSQLRLAACRLAVASSLALSAAMAGAAGPAQAALTVWVEQMTSPELRERIAAGTRTVLIPIGGTEQNGPHMVLGKHNLRAQLLAGRIAQELGDAVVAPVLAYVPEGSISPPAAHMRYAGTISIPEPVFEGLLEAVARSFKQHGFAQVFFLGDHGGYQKSLEKVAARLNHAWASDPACRVYALTDYYRVTQTVYVDELRRRGFSAAEIGEHAGLADTSLSLALDPALVRGPLLASARSAPGVRGDPRRATVDLGQTGVQQIAKASVKAVRMALAAR